MLPPIACGVLAVAALVSAPLTSSLALLRVLVVATAVGAAASAVLLRLRERSGEAELENEVAARSRDELRFEERLAELEFQTETAEEQVKRLERRLLAQRSQIARAEAENQRLVRERARLAAEQAVREAEEARRRELALRGSRPTPTAYLKAASVLRGLERRAAVGEAQRLAAQAPARTAAQKRAQAEAQIQAQLDAQAAAEAKAAEQVTTEQAVTGQPAALPAVATKVQIQPQSRHRAQSQSPQPQAQSQAAAAQGPAWARAALPPLRPASAVLPAPLQRGVTRGAQTARTGTFSFFTRQEDAISNQLGSVPADLADVVGDEAAADQRRYDAAAGLPVEAGAPAPQAAHDRAGEAAAATADAHREPTADGGLVDLTAEDETEPIDVRVLRAL